VDFILAKGMSDIKAKEKTLTQLFLDGLKSIQGVTIYGPGNAARQISIVSFNIDGVMPSEASLALDEQFSIMSRPGLHCAPSAHRTIGTFPGGTVRFSFGCFNTEDEINRALEAVHQLSR
jgi:selenocysteine lyase/cysteine desulfurase